MRLQQRVALNTAALIGARMLVVAAGVVTVGLASRYLHPSGFGALTVAAAFVALFAVFTDLGVYTIAAREIAQDESAEAHIVGNVLGLSLACSAVVAAAAFGFMHVAYGGGHEQQIRQGILILLPQLVAAAPVAACRAHFIASERNWMAALGDVSTAVVSVGLTAAAVALDLGFAAVVGAACAGYVAQAVTMVALTMRRIRLRISVRLTLWRRLATLALPLGLSLVLNYLYFRLDILLLSFLRSTSDVALYGLAYKVLEAFIVLPSYFMTSLFPELARMAPHSKRLNDVVGEALAVMEMLVLPIVVLTAVFAPQIVAIVGGGAFSRAAPTLQILMVGLAASFVNGVYGNTLVAQGRQRSLLRVTVAVLGINLALNLALIPPFGIEGAAVAVSASELLALVLIRRLYLQVGSPPTNPLRARMLGAGAVLLAAIAFRWLPGSNAAIVVAGGAVSLIAYVIALLRFRALPPTVRLLVEPYTRALRRT